MDFFSKGIEAYKNKNYKAAINFWEKSLNKKDLINKSSCYYNIGCCFIQLKEFENAIKYLNKSLENGNFSNKTYFNLAQSYYQLKNYKQAYIAISNALSYDNDDKDTINLERRILTFLLEEIKNK